MSSILSKIGVKTKPVLKTTTITAATTRKRKVKNDDTNVTNVMVTKKSKCQEKITELANKISLVGIEEALMNLNEYSLCQEDMLQLIDLLNFRYYNMELEDQKTKMEDDVYDAILDWMEKKYNIKYTKVGGTSSMTDYSSDTKITSPVSVEEKTTSPTNPKSKPKPKPRVKKEKNNESTPVIKPKELYLLPFKMGSLEKIKQQESKKWDRFVSKYSAKECRGFVASDKCDGVSVLCYFGNYQSSVGYPQMFTRGKTGIVGTDISHLAPYLQWPEDMMTKCKSKNIIAVRAELIYKHTDFNKFQDDPPECLGDDVELKDARSTIAGVVNRRKIISTEMCQAITVLAYKVYVSKVSFDSSEKKDFSQLESIDRITQMNILTDLGFQTPSPILFDQHLTIDEMIEYTTKRKLTAPYDMDGVVYGTNLIMDQDDESNEFIGEPIIVDEHYLKSTDGATDVTDPKDIIAFKIDAPKVEATVIKVEYNLTRFGIFFPRVMLVPFQYGAGVIIEKANGKSARFILENNIGPGSLLLVARSNDVIPDIQGIIKASKSGKAQLPVELGTTADWNDTKVNIELKDPDQNIQVQIQRLEHFFGKKALNVADTGKGNIPKLWNYFYSQRKPTNNLLNHDVLNDMLSATATDFMKIPGYQLTKATKLYNNIKTSLEKNCNLANVMYASSMFGEGFGTDRFKAIIAQYPDVLDWEIPLDNELIVDRSIEKIQKIPGFKQLGVDFVHGLPRFQEWLKRHPILDKCIATQKPEPKSAITSDKFINQVVVMTGFTNKNWKDIINSGGGIVNDGFTQKTTILVCKEVGSLSSKEKSAIKFNENPKNASKQIQIMSIPEFNDFINRK